MHGSGNTQLDLVALTPTMGVEIRGIDLSHDLDTEVFAAIRDAWMTYKVAVFRTQALDSRQLLEFTRRFGPLFVHVRSQFQDLEYKEIMLISNEEQEGRALGALGDGDLSWHSDQAYTARPVWGTLLHALAVPTTGGGTYFCDFESAYEAMPPDLQERVGGCRVGYSIERSGLEVPQVQRAQAPDVSHPLVRRHPYRNLPSLYLSPQHFVEVLGMPQDEGEALFEEVVAWATQPQFLYQHQWRVGDVVMWDNTTTMHRRDAFPPEQLRKLKRTGFHLPKTLGVPVAP